MVAGLPGTGIGGIFYVLLALSMPFWELFRLVRGKSCLKRWITIGTQTCNALGILGGVCLTGWLLACLLNAIRSLSAGAGGAEAGIQRTANVIPAASAYVAIATLGGVILFTHLLRGLVRKSKTLSQTARPMLPLRRADSPILPPAPGGTLVP